MFLYKDRAWLSQLCTNWYSKYYVCQFPNMLTGSKSLQYSSRDIKLSPFIFTIWWSHLIANKTEVKELGRVNMTGFRVNWRIEEAGAGEVKVIPEKKYKVWNVDLVSMVNLVHEATRQGVTMEKVWSVAVSYTHLTLPTNREV